MWTTLSHNLNNPPPPTKKKFNLRKVLFLAFQYKIINQVNHSAIDENPILIWVMNTFTLLMSLFPKFSYTLYNSNVWIKIWI